VTSVNGNRMELLADEAIQRCNALARCTAEPGRITRLFCTPAMREAHRLVAHWMSQAGMTTRVDAAGNLRGMYLPPGCDSGRRIVLGSHLDSVADAGRYDGVLGVVMSIAAVQALGEAAAPLPWAIEVVAFSDEEGVRFAVPFIGSRALAGTLDATMLAACDGGGATVAHALSSFDLDPAQIHECAIESGSVVAYLEPHIEQGPVLELMGEPVGVVTSIAGQTRLTLRWTGQGGHAGTAPMAQRSDPLPAACRWVAAVEDLARNTVGLTATVGRMEVEPNISNCIPRRVAVSLDVRHADDAVRRGAARRLVERAEELARSGGLSLAVEADHEHDATLMHAELVERLCRVIADRGHQPQRLVSGAGHDAGVIAGVAPAAMLFVRSPGGVSHHPDEAVLLADVAAALDVLVKFIENLSIA
jgi:allantoate deiminase